MTNDDSTADRVHSALYEQMAAVLNKILKAEPSIVYKLFNVKVLVRNTGDDNPIVCRANPDGSATTSALGLINTLFFSERYRIQAHFDDKDPSETITHFSVLDYQAGKSNDDRTAGVPGAESRPEP